MCEKIIGFGSQGAAPHICEIYAFWDTIIVLSSYVTFLNKHSDERRGQPIYTLTNGSKDAVWCKKVPLEVVLPKPHIEEFKITKRPNFWPLMEISNQIEK